VGVLSADKVAHQVENLDKEIALLSSVAELMAKAVHIRGLEEENRRLRKIVGQNRTPSMDIIGHSKAMQEVFGLVAQVADSQHHRFDYGRNRHRQGINRAGDS